MAMNTQPRVCLVEDDDDLAETMVELLGDLGHEVQWSRTAIEALEYLRHDGRPCILLCDLVLAGMSGMELVRKVCADETLRHVHAVLVTGIPSVAPTDMAVLPKPFSVSDFLAVVDRYRDEQSRRAAAARGAARE
jgi:two-component system, NtrC family, response regulator AtoC